MHHTYMYSVYDQTGSCKLRYYHVPTLTIFTSVYIFLSKFIIKEGNSINVLSTYTILKLTVNKF